MCVSVPLPFPLVSFCVLWAQVEVMYGTPQAALGCFAAKGDTKADGKR